MSLFLFKFQVIKIYMVYLTIIFTLINIPVIHFTTVNCYEVPFALLTCNMQMMLDQTCHIWMAKLSTLNFIQYVKEIVKSIHSRTVFIELSTLGIK